MFVSESQPVENVESICRTRAQHIADYEREMGFDFDMRRLTVESLVDSDLILACNQNQSASQSMWHNILLVGHCNSQQLCREAFLSS